LTREDLHSNLLWGYGSVERGVWKAVYKNKKNKKRGRIVVKAEVEGEEEEGIHQLERG
jgi:hypothetical protein